MAVPSEFPQIGGLSNDGLIPVLEQSGTSPSGYTNNTIRQQLLIPRYHASAYRNAGNIAVGPGHQATIVWNQVVTEFPVSPPVISSGTLNIPASGKWQVDAHMAASGTANQAGTVSLSVNVNGVEVDRQSYPLQSGDGIPTLRIATTRELTQADSVGITLSSSVRSSGTWTALNREVSTPWANGMAATLLQF